PDCTCGCHDHDHDHEGHHPADEVFDSIGFETSRSFSEAAIKAALEELDSGDFGMILRAKGIVAGEDGNWIHFDYVPGEADVRTGAADVTGKLCVIGSKVDKDAVKVLFGL
ncbi:MAG: GTP-binding protein, partial [Clostridiales bacterium]|nr:GTP-binding protein [Clostridiales bacterium]